jgi:CheY-like chemotaxis protein
MHGGTVGAESDGRGSVFTVRLPEAAASPAAEAAPPEEPPKIAACRILVVDDNRDAAQLLGMTLKVLGNEVATAHDGLEAVQAAEKLRPDVVLMDIGMPRLNGYEAARRIRQTDWGRGLTLVALTGWGQAEDREKTKDAGFDLHLVKPVEPGALRALLADLHSATA